MNNVIKLFIAALGLGVLGYWLYDNTTYEELAGLVAIGSYWCCGAACWEAYRNLKDFQNGGGKKLKVFPRN